MKKDDYVRKCWLLYFNKTLAEKGLISQDEYRKVKLKINQRYQNTPKTNLRNGSVLFCNYNLNNCIN